MPPHPPPRPHHARRRPSPESAERAVELARRALEFASTGPLIARRGPGGVEVLVPLIYQGVALDLIALDPESLAPLPRGAHLLGASEPDPSRAREAVARLVEELRVLDAAEYREPEDAWVVPLAWRSLIVGHVKVSGDGRLILPDRRATDELRRHLL